MRTYNITPAEIIEEILTLADERPDFNYKGQPERVNSYGACSYVSAQFGSTQGEGCIVGQALSRLGVEDHDLLRVEKLAADQVMEVLLEPIRIYKPMTNEVALQLEWISTVQHLQDTGSSWGEATGKGII